VIIADIHYVYSLYPILGGMLEGERRRWSILLDEAHNLSDRARDMFSATLAKAALMRARQAAGGVLRKRLDRVNRQFLALQNESWQEATFDSRQQLPQALLFALQEFVAAISEQLAADPACLQRRPELLDFFFDVLQFQRVAEHWGEEFRLELSRDAGRQSLCVDLRCLDPARLLAVGHGRAHAVTAFSATLSPLRSAIARSPLSRPTSYRSALPGTSTPATAVDRPRCLNWRVPCSGGCRGSRGIASCIFLPIATWTTAWGNCGAVVWMTCSESCGCSSPA
jgi:Rad3-related DNA helicase